eukprot:gnl/MRDRNA2_/MRDRNA2_34475_c0_seq1.p1 gnl/MRDRNA2_/MRDRNA2_34475_c0~~gnl/MRDRNA2_/MRDRNA2_34475_c0_seq1.p1  ORF type:complete len:810 (-),score=149.01 gnl/MRDRNA2_/MRDRNA2_34475_c0_seq1:151-2580(-)
MESLTMESFGLAPLSDWDDHVGDALGLDIGDGSAKLRTAFNNHKHHGLAWLTPRGLGKALEELGGPMALPERDPEGFVRELYSAWTGSGQLLTEDSFMSIYPQFEENQEELLEEWESNEPPKAASNISQYELKSTVLWDVRGLKESATRKDFQEICNEWAKDEGEAPPAKEFVDRVFHSLVDDGTHHLSRDKFLENFPAYCLHWREWYERWRHLGQERKALPHGTRRLVKDILAGGVGVDELYKLLLNAGAHVPHEMLAQIREAFDLKDEHELELLIEVLLASHEDLITRWYQSKQASMASKATGQSGLEQSLLNMDELHTLFAEFTQDGETLGPDELYQVCERIRENDHEIEPLSRSVVTRILAAIGFEGQVAEDDFVAGFNAYYMQRKVCAPDPGASLSKYALKNLFSKFSGGKDYWELDDFRNASAYLFQRDGTGHQPQVEFIDHYWDSTLMKKGVLVGQLPRKDCLSMLNRFQPDRHDLLRAWLRKHASSHSIASATTTAGPTPSVGSPSFSTGTTTPVTGVASAQGSPKSKVASGTSTPAPTQEEIVMYHQHVEVCLLRRNVVAVMPEGTWRPQLAAKLLLARFKPGRRVGLCASMACLAGIERWLSTYAPTVHWDRLDEAAREEPSNRRIFFCTPEHLNRVLYLGNLKAADLDTVVIYNPLNESIPLRELEQAEVDPLSKGGMHPLSLCEEGRPRICYIVGDFPDDIALNNLCPRVPGVLQHRHTTHNALLKYLEAINDARGSMDTALKCLNTSGPKGMPSVSHHTHARDAVAQLRAKAANCPAVLRFGADVTSSIRQRQSSQ